MSVDYRRTLRACYLGIITQAIAANFVPLLFIRFRSEYGVPLGRIALIPAVFFIVQLIVDALCTRYTDRIGYRKSIIASQGLCALGLIGLTVLPDVFGDPFIGIMICVAAYAVGSGLIEVLVSPIVEACPFDDKSAVMSLLHSFYCWGCVGVICLSTVFFAVFGIGYWKVTALLWALIPLVNIRNFAVCPIERLTEEGQGMTVPELLKKGLFWMALVLMVCAGASELAMAQWASAFTEAALRLPKAMGDLAGPCLFAVAMGVSRVLYSRYASRMDLRRAMMLSGFLCLLSYLAAGLSRQAFIGLAGCVLCGFSVGIMWPGTISLISPRFPRGGTALFALLAMAGDLGGAVGPALVGAVSQRAGEDLQAGMLFGCVFPVVLAAVLVYLGVTGRKGARKQAGRADNNS